jgi:hypothetical protein
MSTEMRLLIFEVFTDLFIYLFIYLDYLLEFNVVPSGQPFEGTRCLNLPTMHNEAPRSSETSVNF